MKKHINYHEISQDRHKTRNQRIENRFLTSVRSLTSCISTISRENLRIKWKNLGGIVTFIFLVSIINI